MPDPDFRDPSKQGPLPVLKTRSDFLRVAAAKRKWACTGVLVQVAQRNSDSRKTNGSMPAIGTDGAGISVLPSSVAEPSPSDASAGETLPRVGFTASRKVGNSVIRNRARRRLREAARRLLRDHGLPSLDYVLIAREATATRAWDDLLGDLRYAMRKLNAWRD